MVIHPSNWTRQSNFADEPNSVTTASNCSQRALQYTFTDNLLCTCCCCGCLVTIWCCGGYNTSPLVTHAARRIDLTSFSSWELATDSSSRCCVHKNFTIYTSATIIGSIPSSFNGHFPCDTGQLATPLAILHLLQNITLMNSLVNNAQKQKNNLTCKNKDKGEAQLLQGMHSLQ